MNYIPLSDAIRHLDNAAAVIVDDEYVTFAQVEHDAEAHEPFLSVSPNDDTTEQRFRVADNPLGAGIDESGCLVLISTKGQEITFELLRSERLLANP